MLVIFVAIFVLLLTGVLWWVRRTFTFWNGKGITHLTFCQYMRFAYDIYTKPLNDVVTQAYSKYGRVYGSYQGTVPTLVVGEPDILREILVTKFKHFADRSLSQTVGSDVWKKAIMNLHGEEWKKVRTIFTPALTTTRLRTIMAKVKTISGRMTSRLMDAAAKKMPVDFFELSNNTQLDITTALNYSVDIDSEKEKDHPL
nr:lithocholate 6-beta-hydroxylase-like [Rhipicephalus microplus]